MNRFTKWINQKETDHYTKKLIKITEEIKLISQNFDSFSIDELSKELKTNKRRSSQKLKICICYCICII